MPIKIHKEPTKPFCVRLTDKERQELVHRAGRRARGTYIKAYLFNKNAPSCSQSSKTDNKALAGLLAWLGQSNMATHLRDLAKASRNGSLPLTPETTSKLEQACKDIAAIKSTLMKSLGIKEQ